MEKNSYSRLKTQYFEIDKATGSDQITLDIQKSNLIVGIFCPEIDASFEAQIRRINLEPYEYAVHQFGTGDYLYDQTQFNSPSSRVIKRLDILRTNTLNTNGKCPIIIAYLEFN